MTAHHHDPIDRNAVQDGLARLDRLRGLVVEDRRPVGVLQARNAGMNNGVTVAATASVALARNILRRLRIVGDFVMFISNGKWANLLDS